MGCVWRRPRPLCMPRCLRPPASHAPDPYWHRLRSPSCAGAPHRCLKKRIRRRPGAAAPARHGRHGRTALGAPRPSRSHEYVAVAVRPANRRARRQLPPGGHPAPQLPTPATGRAACAGPGNHVSAKQPGAMVYIQYTVANRLPNLAAAPRPPQRLDDPACGKAARAAWGMTGHFQGRTTANTKHSARPPTRRVEEHRLHTYVYRYVCT